MHALPFTRTLTPWRAACRLVLLLLAWLGAGASHASTTEALLTLLDGGGRILDARGSFAAVEGARFAGVFIVQTEPSARLLRLEWPGGTALDLGPDTQLLVAPAGIADKPGRAALYLLRGWAKLSTAPAEPAPHLVSLYSQVTVQQGAVVAFVGQGKAWAFEESGSAQVTERPPRGNPIVLSNGGFFSRSGSDPLQLASAPPAATLRDVPRAFRETLPRRYAAMATKALSPKPVQQPSYPELREWLSGEVAVRRILAGQFSHWLRDNGLRDALLAQEKDYPEWAPVLHPERSKRP